MRLWKLVCLPWRGSWTFRNKVGGPRWYYCSNKNVWLFLLSYKKQIFFYRLHKIAEKPKKLLVCCFWSVCAFSSDWNTFTVFLIYSLCKVKVFPIHFDIKVKKVLAFTRSAASISHFLIDTAKHAGDCLEGQCDRGHQSWDIERMGANNYRGFWYWGIFHFFLLQSQYRNEQYRVAQLKFVVTAQIALRMLLGLFQPINLHFLANKNAELGWSQPVKLLKHRGHFSLLSDPIVHSLYCAPILTLSVFRVLFVVPSKQSISALQFSIGKWLI